MTGGHSSFQIDNGKNLNVYGFTFIPKLLQNINVFKDMFIIILI